MLRSIQHDLRSGDPELALEHWTELNDRVPDVQVEPAVLARIARNFAEMGRGFKREPSVGDFVRSRLGRVWLGRA